MVCTWLRRTLCVMLVFRALTASSHSCAAERPNIVLIIADDMGFGDLGIHGNTQINTPNLDALGREGVRLTQFCVSPVCTPTRASLMTGRYNYRTRAVDTYQGRAMMDPAEVTLAEVLSNAGYRTGIFGKWHLGDNYPMRAMDQGFQESLVHGGGGIAQPADPPEGSAYQDPMLSHNGILERRRGYCTDIFADAAIDFIEKQDRRPFFAYIATNAPHDPLQVADDLVTPYRAKGLPENTARVYAMVENIDRNVGRVLSSLQARGLDKNTIVIFLTDNGPAFARYNSGMRGLKTTVYQGGIRVPCFVRWPSGLVGGREVHVPSAHIDLFPTLLAASKVGAPRGGRIDGMNLLPALKSGAKPPRDRSLFFQWHRGDMPEAFRNSAVRNGRYKLVDGKELYDPRSTICRARTPCCWT